MAIPCDLDIRNNMKLNGGTNKQTDINPYFQTSSLISKPFSKRIEASHKARGITTLKKLLFFLFQCYESVFQQNSD
jgi:hypothetical protein